MVWKLRGKAFAAGAMSIVIAAASSLPVAAASNTYAGLSVEQAVTQEAGAAITRETAPIREQNVINKLKKLIPAVEKAVETHVDFFGVSEEWGIEEANWGVTFYLQNGSLGGSYSLYAEVNAITGDLMRLDFPEELLGSPVYYLDAVSRDEAKATAEAFALEALSSLKPLGLALVEDEYNTKAPSLFGATSYSFWFQVSIGGVPLQYVTVDMQVNGDGTVTYFSVSEALPSVQELTAALTEEEAVELFGDHLGLQLAYANISDYGEKPDWVLLWYPNSEVYYIDAVSGQRFDMNGVKVEQTDGERYSELSPPETEAVHDGNASPAADKRHMSAERAIAIVDAVLPIPVDYTLTEKALDMGAATDAAPTWTLIWEEDGEEASSDDSYGPAGRISATVDARSGRVTQLYHDINVDWATEYAVISEKDALAAADEYVHKLHPEAAVRLKRVHSSTPAFLEYSQTYQFYYQPFVNGYPVLGESVFVEISAQGDLDYYKDSAGALPPSMEETIKPKADLAQAQRFYESKLDISPLYVTFDGYNDDTWSSDSKLVYELSWDDSVAYEILDALTGKLRAIPHNSSIPEESALISMPIDLEGHAAEAAFTTLLELGVVTLDEAGTVRPDEAITKEEWALWTAAAAYPDYGYYGGYDMNGQGTGYADVSVDSELYQALELHRELGWLEAGNAGSFEPDQVVAREEMADWISHMLHYDKLAVQLQYDPQLIPIKDRRQISNPGAAALMMKLDLMEAAGRYWLPDTAVTRGEAAQLLLKLAELQAELDQALGYN